MPILDVLIIGAGPSGLATAIAASRAGLGYLVVEKGVLVNSLQHYPTNMVFFTTPELMEVGGLPFTSPYQKPTRQEALAYYRRVAETFHLDLEFGEEVTDVHASGTDGFEVRSRASRGESRVRRARTVVASIGAYDRPNRLEVPGEDLPHVSHYYSEPHAGFRKAVVIVGGKNSAAEAALEIYRAGGRVTLVHRGATLGGSIKYWVRPDIENRIKEGSIAARFETRIVEIRPASVLVESAGRQEEIPADLVLLMTGYRPDLDLLARAGVAIEGTAVAPRHDPETFETNIPGLYVAGAVVAGAESGRIFIENGRFHGEQVVKAIAGKLAGGGRL
jgi:thioredoxin reductase (NADPH)